MKSAHIRQAFLDYFKKQGHTIVSSSSLIPENDPSLLFTNAGMVQFKDIFLGRQPSAFTRATSVQRCLRAGGKHNDLENVGYTARHHTFFEMLGNFSFGDYFKREAIAYAWEFLTEILKLPKEKLWITVFEKDQEAEDIWFNDIKIDPRRFSRCGEKDNFWAMGETGPCGPCTEIFYDHGPSIPGGPPGSGDEGDRYIEIWNLVFMQYNRTSDGHIELLPKPSVDTGMGLERIAAVMQGVHNNYDIDIFKNLIKAIAQLASISDLQHVSLKVIADHIRSSSFLITDGVMPSNEGRGYVLRRIIRRALRHGHKLGFREPFFYKLVPVLIQEMGEAYPELTRAHSLIEKVLQREEELFATTLEQGLKILEHKILSLKGKIIPGDIVFKLYDTYGFPLDLTADIARERGLNIDEEAFHKEMTQQRERSLAASQFSVDYTKGIQTQEISTFTGYNHLTETSIITAIADRDGKPLPKLLEGDTGIVVLAQTPFYAEGGGQIGDEGSLTTDASRFEVQDTQKQGQTIIHIGKMAKGSLHINDQVRAEVNIKKRRATAYNHSATHLLNAALRELLGEHVLQKGSLVEPERLRFDFSHFEPLTSKQIKAIEYLVNEKIRENLPVTVKYMTPEEAMDSGALALFGEKYGAEVRVLSMGDFSLELCGGTHVNRTGDIGVFKIISEAGIASGIRRIEAITGEHALDWMEKNEVQLNELAALLKIGREQISEKVKQLSLQLRQFEKEIEQLRAKMATSTGGDLSQEAKEINGIHVLAKKIEHADSKLLRELVDKLKQKFNKTIIVLACIEEGKVRLVGGVTKNLTETYHAGELINYISEYLDGKGGGRPDLAQGGGVKINEIDQALELVFEWVKEKGKK